MGTQRKVSVAGAITTMNPAELEVPATNIVNTWRDVLLVLSVFSQVVSPVKIYPSFGCVVLVHLELIAVRWY